MLREWKCFYCGEKVVEGQQFTFIGDKAIHIHCLRKLIMDECKESCGEVLEGEMLLKALEASASTIVAFKHLKLSSSNEDLEKFFLEMQTKEEIISTEITKKIMALLDRCSTK
ncbi:MAG: DUF2175 family protein [Candidatus Njordarchaeia archaeon]